MQNPLKGMMDTSDAGTLGTALAEKQKIIEQDKAAQSAAPTPAPVKATMTSPKDKINPSNKYGSRPGEKRMPEAEGWAKPISFKDGGQVKKTGLAMVHKGEHVLTEQQHGNMNHAFDLAGTALAQQSPEPDMPKKNIKEMHMRKGANGGFIVKHIHDHYTHPDEEHVHSDMDGVHDHMEQHWGEPNDGEEEHESAGVQAAEEAIGLK